jgi:methyl-accepting chemotaxis protein
MDTFQFEALNVFSSGADTKHYRFENYNDQYSIRYIVPDFATSTSCVDCHNKYNRHPEAVEQDYKLGSILGALEVVVPLEDMKITVANELRRSLIYGLAVIVIMGVLGFVVLSYSISTPVQNLIETLKAFAKGDLTRDVMIEGSGEFRTLARESSEAINSIEEIIKSIRVKSEESIEISDAVTEMCRDFVESAYKQGTALHTVTSGMENINVSTSDLGKGTGSLTSAAERGIVTANELGAGISEVLNNVDIITTDLNDTSQRSEDLTLSLNEITVEIEGLANSSSTLTGQFKETKDAFNEVETKILESAELSGSLIEGVKGTAAAVEKTKAGISRTLEISTEASRVITNLSERVMEIGRILDIIRTVSEETNLLALNAAIIATKSGRYGKSFSVVAGEITELAERTSTSTKEVTKIIDLVQAESQKAAYSVERGLKSVEENSENSIAAADALGKLAASTLSGKEKIDDISALTSKVGKDANSLSTSMDKLDESAAGILTRSREQAREYGLMGEVISRTREVSSKCKESVKVQINTNQDIIQTVEDLNRMVSHINEAVHTQSLTLTRILLNVEASRGLSIKNIDKAKDTEEALGRLALTNRVLKENIARFKLKS